ncbi:tagatose-bisphosphate aldolase [Tetragenococcus koreensis]|uniref:tagatose-bisphosphate aldolase n=1 Tax=Tetragenococcus koreensis TaxID=290335 RepID=UPI001F27423D|nr:tagatose-bisphosphate aldolase [Tetragenococcus koreensis]MCF1616494.1 tagatose-bisphosphate aldolase [Tetragenococcus koreensis]MCF1621426.1 tagatose-bisphosphate aldolase [Tetragenococcus koreensis]MCF1631987.1 tagatose-bisphosphate aldolase [Tetragenococcus koreensis]MCF1677539.1 tagatose-bisphosphate aldolase [Tetragenococcus koreensis]MCF1679941.1 tagatose-bisphosphate aldolase [Tetragenococcus koreensis]
MADKQSYMKQLSDKNHIISALAIDQRGALQKMINKYQGEPATAKQIEKFKEIVSAELTPYTSAILLDPEYGLPATKVKDKHAGELLAYEQTGYDTNVPGRLPDLLPTWSVQRIKEQGADACKFLLYYDVDESDEINEQKHVIVERIGAECKAEGIPFFLELVTYDASDSDNSTKEFALKKPHKVNEAMKEFSKSRYGVDVLKVEVPVNMAYVEGYAEEEIAYTQEEALEYFKEQTQSTKLPFIFLSAGVTADMFQETLRFAKQAGSEFNGVLCGRATWADGVEIFATKGEKAARQWMQTQGRKNIEELNEVLQKTATPIKF